MKKWLIMLSLAVVAINCKDKNETPAGTNEKGEKLTVNENGDTIAVPQNDTPATEADTAENTALKKNEDESYSFRYNLQKGETYPFKLKITQNQSMTAGGQSMNLSSTRTVDFDYLVEDVVNNQFNIKATFKGFSESFKSPNGETVSYSTSSAKPSNPDAAQSWTIYKAITGHTFQMKVDNKGKVVSINGLDKVISGTMAKLKNDFSEKDQKDIRDLLNTSLSNEAIKAQFEESLNIFPDKNLKVGGQWEDTQNLSEGPVKGQNKVTRTLKEVSNGKAKITVAGVQDVSGTQSQNGIEATMKNHATLSGYIDLDMASGWIKKVNIVKKETINTTYRQGEQKETESGTSTTTTTVN